MSHASVKGEAFIDLVAEFTEIPFKKKKKIEKQNMDGKSTGMVSLHQTLLSRRIHIDDVANQRGSEVELILASPENVLLLTKVSTDICLSIVQMHRTSHYDIFYKCSNRTKIMPEVLIPDALGKLTR